MRVQEHHRRIETVPVLRLVRTVGAEGVVGPGPRRADTRPCQTSPVRAGRSWRATSRPLLASKMTSSTRVAWLEYTAKLTPRRLQVAPSGRADPG